MNGYFITGIGAGLLGIAIGFGGTHVYDGRAIAVEKTALATEQAAYQADIAKINAASAQALADALKKQQAAEGQVASVEAQYNTEVSNHAKDILALRAQLASGAQQLRVHVTAASCHSGAPAGQSAAASSSTDDTASYAVIDGQTASGIVQVAADDQAEIDKLAALQAYVRTLQDQGYISK
jgi:hypothetical protein